MASIGHEPKSRSAAYGRRSNILEEQIASLTTDVEAAVQGRRANHETMDGLIAGRSCCICFSVDRAEPRWSFSDDPGDVYQELRKYVVDHRGEKPFSSAVDAMEEYGVLLDAVNSYSRATSSSVAKDEIGEHGGLREFETGRRHDVSMSMMPCGQQSVAERHEKNVTLEDRERGKSTMEASRTFEYGSWEKQTPENAAMGAGLDTGLVESSGREEQASMPLTAGSSRDQG